MTELQFLRGISIKRGDVSQAGEFAGYGATYDRDRVGDTIVRGAFAKSLTEHKAAGSMPAMLWNHDPDKAIGRWLTLAEDSKGLRVTGKLTLAAAHAKDAHALMLDDALSLSIGYRIRPGGLEAGRGTTLLKNLELFEISVVSVPANPHARITQAKDISALREFEDYFHRKGYSRSEVKRMASAAWAALQKRNEPPYQSAVALLKQHTAALTKGN